MERDGVRPGAIGADMTVAQPQPPAAGRWRESAGAGTTRGVSAASGRSESRSAPLNRRRECSRRKKTTKVNTRHKLMVRVSGTTVMARGAED